MIQKYTTYKILQLFFDYPSKSFQLREICRLVNLGMPSVKLHIERLEKSGLVTKQKTGVYSSYKASRNDYFRLYRRVDVQLRLHETGLIDFLTDKLSPNAIVLFGSAARGEDLETSDVDLFVIAGEKDVNLKEYETKIKRKIHIMFGTEARKIPKELLNNIINGIVIYGYLKVF